MGFVLRIAISACFALGLAQAAAAATRQPPRASHEPITGATSTPWGWVDFCQRYVEECAGGQTTPVDVDLTARNWALIEQVDERVNHTIKPMSDWEHWGVIDQWDLPLDGYGDCEDYALLKRKLLISLGLPAQALLMTIVKDEQGEGHAILTVKTNRGDFILDNMRDGVRAWNALPYTYVKRQSQTDANIWEQIGEPTAAPASVAH